MPRREDTETWPISPPSWMPPFSFLRHFVTSSCDTQANDHPLATAIGPQRNGPLHPGRNGSE